MPGVVSEEIDLMTRVRVLLERWGAYMRTIKHPCRSYPGQSAFVNPERSGDEAPPEGFCNEEFEVIERAMRQLKAISRPLYFTLSVEYLVDPEQKATNKDKAHIVTKKIRDKCSEATFKAWRTTGEYFIAGKISSHHLTS